jgi:hypothetical protein
MDLAVCTDSLGYTPPRVAGAMKRAPHFICVSQTCVSPLMRARLSSSRDSLCALSVVGDKARGNAPSSSGNSGCISTVGTASACPSDETRDVAGVVVVGLKGDAVTEPGLEPGRDDVMSEDSDRGLPKSTVSDAADSSGVESGRRRSSATAASALGCSAPAGLLLNGDRPVQKDMMAAGCCSVLTRRREGEARSLEGCPGEAHGCGWWLLVWLAAASCCCERRRTPPVGISVSHMHAATE